jgi:hypothetical protein
MDLKQGYPQQRSYLVEWIGVVVGPSFSSRFDFFTITIIISVDIGVRLLLRYQYLEKCHRSVLLPSLTSGVYGLHDLVFIPRCSVGTISTIGLYRRDKKSKYIKLRGVLQTIIRKFPNLKQFPFKPKIYGLLWL